MRRSNSCWINRSCCAVNGAGQALRNARDVLATDQISQIGKLCGPGKLLQNGPQKKEATDVDGLRQGRGLRAQMGKPAEDVRITAQLI